MISKISQITKRVLFALRTYPLVLLMSVVVASIIIYLIENDESIKEMAFIKLILCSSLGISILFSAKMLAQRFGKELIFIFVALLILVGFYYILPASTEDFNEVYAFIIIPTYILSHLFVSFAAFIREKSEVSFWQYNKNLFINFIVTLIFTGVLTLGVILALLAVQNLFNIDFREQFYAETAIVLGIVGNTLIFLLFNDNGLKYLETSTPYPVVLKFFTQFILIPLLLLYAVILYFYSGKILITWELPQGWVSYLILAYSMIGILALLLVHPLKNDSARSWVKIFSQVFYYSLIPLIVLLFTAIFTRILEYGYTEPRYYVLLLAVWFLTVQLYFIFYNKATIKFIPMSLFAFGIFALLFPGLNSFAIAKRSQKNQLEQILESNQLLQNGKILFDKKIPSEVAESISDKFEFLSIRDQKDYLMAYLPAKIAEEEKDSRKIYISSYFTNITRNPAKPSESRYLTLVNSNTFYKIDEYDYATLENNLLNGKARIGNDVFHLTKELYGTQPKYILRLASGENVDLLPIVEAKTNQYKVKNGTILVDNLFIETDLGNYHIKINFNEINYLRYDGSDTFYADQEIYLIKKKDK